MTGEGAVKRRSGWEVRELSVEYSCVVVCESGQTTLTTSTTTTLTVPTSVHPNSTYALSPIGRVHSINNTDRHHDMACSVLSASTPTSVTSHIHLPVELINIISTAVSIEAVHLLRIIIMRTRSSTAAATASDSATSLPSLPIACLTRVSKRRSTTTASDPSSPPPTQPTKRLKPTVSVTAVNRQTIVDLSTLHSYLGHLIPIVNGGQAKGGVVAALTQLLPHRSAASSTSTHYPQPIRLPTFNRLCGWLHLHNTLCLFINIPPPPATTTTTTTTTSPIARYTNLFTPHKGRLYFTWYTPASVQPTHPLVDTLRNATVQSEITVLLLCRRMGSGSSSSSSGNSSSSGGGVEGYRYYGRVGYVSHDGSVRPIQFVLELLDAKRVEAVMRQEQLEQQQRTHDISDDM